MMLDKLTEELTTVVQQNIGSLSKTAPSGFDSVSSPVKAPEIKENSKSPETELKISIMDDLFCGELCTSITCPHCNNKSEKRETFYYLSVPLPQEVCFVSLTPL